MFQHKKPCVSKNTSQQTYAGYPQWFYQLLLTPFHLTLFQGASLPHGTYDLPLPVVLPPLPSLPPNNCKSFYILGIALLDKPSSPKRFTTSV